MITEKQNRINDEQGKPRVGESLDDFYGRVARMRMTLIHILEQTMYHGEVSFDDDTSWDVLDDEDRCVFCLDKDDLIAFKELNTDIEKNNTDLQDLLSGTYKRPQPRTIQQIREEDGDAVADFVLRKEKTFLFGKA